MERGLQRLEPAVPRHEQSLEGPVFVEFFGSP